LVQTNVLGTFELLEASRRMILTFPQMKSAFRFVLVSTDEVYGSLGPKGFFKEETPYAPNSPYSATKAGADYLGRAYFQTHGLSVLTTHCSNNYGPFQFPEKLIPLTLLNAMEGKNLPIYGDGSNVRDWIHVEDHCIALVRVAQGGRPGEIYNVGGGNEVTNLNLVKTLCGCLEAQYPARKNSRLIKKGIRRYEDLMTFVADRPGHDRRYAIDDRKTRRELGWKPMWKIGTGLKASVRWYLDHMDWCRAVQSNSYHRERLGLARKGEKS
jgi:dTDP-glucose 4,6-dehydratase